MTRLAIASLAALFVAATILPTPGKAEDRRQGRRTRIAKLLEKIDAQRNVEYAKASDVNLKLDIYRPKGIGEKKLPSVVWIHGGGWRGGDKRGGIARVAHLVASGNYVGVSVGYRLSGVAKWPAQIHDCKAAIRYLRANAAKYNIDPDRIGVWGSSAGGHLVSMLGTSGDVQKLDGSLGTTGISSRVQCVVDFCGPSDFIAFAEKSPRLNSAAGPVGLLLGGSVLDKKEAAKEASPISYVTKDDPPFLIFHGTEDAVVPLDQAVRLHAALQKAGVDVTLVKIDGGGHGIGGAEVYQRLTAFFDKHLRGKDVVISDAVIKK